MNKAWQLYIVQTAAGVLYTGITTDVARRVEQHESGRGAGAPPPDTDPSRIAA
ncbi:MAG: GIY-YIG nuclease family protein, partial [Kalamiella piersonii]|uniref:GIY-YIG nuclease family protein n=1 Tax=Pantoea piersonii TaxID=2364647 RepID=UPI00242EAE8C